MWLDAAEVESSVILDYQKAPVTGAFFVLNLVVLFLIDLTYERIK